MLRVIDLLHHNPAFNQELVHELEVIKMHLSSYMKSVSRGYMLFSFKGLSSGDERSWDKDFFYVHMQTFVR